MDDHDPTAGTAPSLNGTPLAAEVAVASAQPGNATSAFLAELARALHVAAGHERERIAAETAEAAAAHIERTQARAASEIEELRRLADEDIERIHQWSVDEIERIHAEDARRTEQRRADLDGYLEEHDALIATEIEGVHAAVRDYQATLDAYFDAMIESSDPADIAARAGSLPPPPDLDAVRAAARGAAAASVAPPAPDEVDAENSQAVVLAGPTADDDENPSPVDDAPAVGAMDPEPVGVAVMDPDAIGETGDLPGELAPDAVGVAVMDPDAIGETGELPGEPAPDPVGEPAMASSADDETVNETGVHAHSAVRLLRTIAPWTAPSASTEPQDSESLVR